MTKSLIDTTYKMFKSVWISNDIMSLCESAETGFSNVCLRAGLV